VTPGDGQLAEEFSDGAADHGAATI
jgi:hypothetical protein